jgi:hypothetical protein
LAPKEWPKTATEGPSDSTSATRSSNSRSIEYSGSSGLPRRPVDGHDRELARQDRLDEAEALGVGGGAVDEHERRPGAHPRVRQVDHGAKTASGAAPEAVGSVPATPRRTDE